MDESSKRPDPMVGFRCPPELRAALEEAASKEDRTLAAECLRRLRRSFSPEALFVDSVKAMEGPEARRKLDDYVRAMAEECYGPVAGNSVLAFMRIFSG